MAKRVTRLSKFREIADMSIRMLELILRVRDISCAMLDDDRAADAASWRAVSVVSRFDGARATGRITGRANYCSVA
ncbi:MAG: hypothetical protein ABSF94_06995 [Steroidobacteraceae bacterium]|jgi:hypothetical protein